MPSILVIDAGNTMIKWGIYQNTWLLQGEIKNADFSVDFFHRQSLPAPDKILLSHVSTPDIKAQLIESLSFWPVDPEWITSLPVQCGVSNHYHHPEQLGCDRWAALIGAWHIQKQAGLVIDVGTAVTIDMLSGSGDFLGGIIIPGPTLMLENLGKKTAKINAETGRFELFPADTNNAIYSGIIHASVGAISRMQAVLLTHIKETVSQGEHIISGGGAQILLPHLEMPIKHIHNLVLEGLVVIARDSVNNNNK